MGSENLERFIEAYQNIGAYYLVPSFAPEGFDGSQPPKFGWEYFIGLRGLYIREAYEIGPNDIDATVIREGDDPIIPEEHKDDAPILNLLENRKEE
ncbi:hypothetical protein SAMN05443144_1283 [Fodinibius roseus]|uniref:Uncharacterized protein n=1 Tax=Fodinibius roseus TaxID=1194090 RepID=A0A1M5JP94_9BACT|nr:hypothetical protein [Fodinibius roseus]SHG42351.1 hypothetical protein SAMN05443144_1283 [Fodinibius roseus]